MQLPLPRTEISFHASEPAPTRAQRIFINRTLRMDQIEAVGFDMDYTLAIYRQEAMDRQSIAATLPKLLKKGYPEEILRIEPKLDFATRGLLVDRVHGNVLKMDRYRYVKRAFHGYRELDVEERRDLYHKKRITSGAGRFHFVDTLYSLCEVALYAAIIDDLEKYSIPVDYEKLWNDIRASVDASHQDGTILDTVLADLPRFVERDPELASTLHKLRSSGKRLFLLTNSQPAYTDAMMRYLLSDQLAGYPSWRRYFDAVITAARKPLFFHGKEPFEEWVDGKLFPAETLERGRTYVGGNLKELEQRFGLVGDRVLYVGDHIYGDVLRAKKEGAWRTMMIVQELAEELEVVEGTTALAERMEAIERARELLVDEQRARQNALKKVQRALDEDLSHELPAREELDAERIAQRRALDSLREKLDEVEAEYASLERELESSFHPCWGSIFRAGPEVSGFGDQVEEFACLYTTKASNLANYSAAHSFLSPRERMPHEL